MMLYAAARDNGDGGSDVEEDDDFSCSDGEGISSGVKANKKGTNAATDEERLLRCRERNRVHARNTRERKKSLMDSLQFRIQELIEEKKRLHNSKSESTVAGILMALAGGGNGNGNGSSSAREESEATSGDDASSSSSTGHAHTGGAAAPPSPSSSSAAAAGSATAMLISELEDGDGISPTLASLKVQVSALLGDNDYLDVDHELLMKDKSTCSTLELEMIRRERNRMHAKKTRLRKKKMIQEMEAIINKLEREVTELKTGLILTMNGGTTAPARAPSPVAADELPLAASRSRKRGYEAPTGFAPGTIHPTTTAAALASSSSVSSLSSAVYASATASSFPSSYSSSFKRRKQTATAAVVAAAAPPLSRPSAAARQAQRSRELLAHAHAVPAPAPAPAPVATSGAGDHDRLTQTADTASGVHELLGMKRSTSFLRASGAGQGSLHALDLATSVEYASSIGGLLSMGRSPSLVSVYPRNRSNTSLESVTTADLSSSKKFVEIMTNAHVHAEGRAGKSGTEAAARGGACALGAPSAATLQGPTGPLRVQAILATCPAAVNVVKDVAGGPEETAAAAASRDPRQTIAIMPLSHNCDAHLVETSATAAAAAPIYSLAGSPVVGVIAPVVVTSPVAPFLAAACAAHVKVEPSSSLPSSSPSSSSSTAAAGLCDAHGMSLDTPSEQKENAILQ